MKLNYDFQKPAPATAGSPKKKALLAEIFGDEEEAEDEQPESQPKKDDAEALSIPLPDGEPADPPEAGEVEDGSGKDDDGLVDQLLDQSQTKVMHCIYLYSSC